MYTLSLYPAMTVNEDLLAWTDILHNVLYKEIFSTHLSTKTFRTVAVPAIVIYLVSNFY